jgi:hypothetical protein
MSLARDRQHQCGCNRSLSVATQGFVVDTKCYTTVSTIGGFSVRLSDAGPCMSDPTERSNSWPFNQQSQTLVGRTGHSVPDDIVLVIEKRLASVCHRADFQGPPLLRAINRNEIAEHRVFFNLLF